MHWPLLLAPSEVTSMTIPAALEVLRLRLEWISFARLVVFCFACLISLPSLIASRLTSCVYLLSYHHEARLVTHVFI